MGLNEVIEECLEGKEGAWRMLVDTYSKRVFNMAYHFAGSFEEAEDLTQDIFLKLYNSLSKYDRGKNFTAWLLTLAKNHLIDSYRKTKWEKANREEFDEHLASQDSGDSPDVRLLKEASRKAVWKSLNSLPAEARMAVILRDIQGKSYEEVAEIMSVPIGTVKSRINRGRLELAKILSSKKETIHDL
ncbi:MAG: RNA polymerase sigma factor [Clostridiales bacterium]|nr:RNA polymerase sigma factor [Clostridiales bacterium]